MLFTLQMTQNFFQVYKEIAEIPEIKEAKILEVKNSEEQERSTLTIQVIILL